MNELTTRPDQALALNEDILVATLGTSLYPGASPASIRMVLNYCRAAGLDPMQKPVHIVPMWDAKAKQMRDVILPGINSYRVAAARSHEFVGMSEPLFGDIIAGEFTDKDGRRVKVDFPEWCRVTVRRLVAGTVAEFTAVEYWEENYATAGKDSDAPNAMWKKRPRGQLAKCAQAQALRIAFPELASPMTAEEMEGKPIDPTGEIIDEERPPACPPDLLLAAQRAADAGREAFGVYWANTLNGATRTQLAPHLEDLKTRTVDADKAAATKKAAEATPEPAAENAAPAAGADDLAEFRAGLDAEPQP